MFTACDGVRGIGNVMELALGKFKKMPAVISAENHGPMGYPAKPLTVTYTVESV